jgi:hypothetical protein
VRVPRKEYFNWWTFPDVRHEEWMVLVRWFSTHIVHNIHVGMRLHQYLDHLRVAMDGCLVKSCVATLCGEKYESNKYTCRLHHEVQVSNGFTHWGPHAGPRLRKSRRDRTEWCNQLVPWATWPWQRIYSPATLASAIKGSSAYLATVQTVVYRVDARHRWTVSRRRFQSNSSFFLDIQNNNTINAVYKRQSLCLFQL